ncbi:unnamed protein product [Trichobilharzia regenti]|nr:unnamed protein product [Trichobilharzia regenti]
MICQELKTLWEQLSDNCLPPVLDFDNVDSQLAINCDAKKLASLSNGSEPSKYVLAVSYSLAQLVERSPSSEQLGFVIRHLEVLCRRLSDMHNPQYFQEYLSVLTSFIHSLAKFEFMSSFEEEIEKRSTSKKEFKQLLGSNTKPVRMLMYGVQRGVSYFLSPS